ncbi:MAG: VanZ family protein [Clostridia bacterium]|nr:VanZ family protein [Clostridia bacterium]
MKTLLRVILWAAVIGWMALIFSFSVETAAESTETSGGFIEFFMAKWIPGFTELTDAEQTAKIESVTYFVRKSAHFVVFAVLGFLTCAALWSCDVSVKRAFLLAAVIGALYAVSDEVHQVFVPGRAGMIRDVILDTCGVVTGSGAMTLVRLIVKKIKHKSFSGR